MIFLRSMPLLCDFEKFEIAAVEHYVAATVDPFANYQHALACGESLVDHRVKVSVDEIVYFGVCCRVLF